MPYFINVCGDNIPYCIQKKKILSEKIKRNDDSKFISIHEFEKSSMDF